MSNTSLYSIINSWNLDKILQFTKLEYPEISNEAWLEALGEYRNYMYLGLVSGKYLQIPNKVMDYIWHSHILHTSDYQDFCYTVNGGKLIHHEPSLYVETKFNDDFKSLSATSKKYLGYNAFETTKNSLVKNLVFSCPGITN